MDQRNNKIHEIWYSSNIDETTVTKKDLNSVKLLKEGVQKYPRLENVYLNIRLKKATKPNGFFQDFL